jgi:hypothetical protein
MNLAQWLFEHKAMRRRDREVVDIAGTFMEMGLKSLRELLINLLGLNLVHRSAAEAEAEKRGEELPKDFTPFVPLSFIVGRPDVVSKLQEEYAQADQASRATKDATFDAWSRELQRRLESGDMGDMEPILVGPQFESREQEWMALNADLLKSLGVTIRGESEEQEKEKLREEIDEIVQEVVPLAGGTQRLAPDDGESSPVGLSLQLDEE